MKKILIDSGLGNEVRVAVVNNNGQIVDLEYERLDKRPIRGNIYVAKITRIEPSLQAVFIEYSADKKSGFLPLDAIHPGYHNQPSLAKASPLNSVKIKDICFLAEGTKNDIDAQTELAKAEYEKKEHLDNEIELDASELDLIEQVVTSQINKKDIDKVLTVGQLLLVQAVKDERGSKGATFTTYISLMGRYCVFMPAIQDKNGISKKISHNEERKRLNQIVARMIGDNHVSVVVRTSALRRSAQDVMQDYQYVARLWNKICDTAIKADRMSFIHQEDNIIHRTVKDLLDENVMQIIVQGEELYKETLHSIEEIAQQDKSKLKSYQDRIPLFTKYKVEQQLGELYQPIVTLPSGGYIIINPTEALIAIDVNSGKDTSEKNLADTALKTNLEAAREIARQIRLRDLSGLIVIDFIDVTNAEHKKLIEKVLKESLSSDRARIQTSNISNFGLLEMSRQRLKPSFLEYSAVICSNCNGKGIVRDDDAHSLLILRTLETEVCSGKMCDTMNVYVHRNIICYFLNYRRHDVLRLEQKYQVKLNFYIDPEANSDSFSIEKVLNHTKKKITAKPLLNGSVYTNTCLISESVTPDLLEQNSSTARKVKEIKRERGHITAKSTKKLKENETDQNKNIHEKRRIATSGNFVIDKEQFEFQSVEEDGEIWHDQAEQNQMNSKPREMISAKKNRMNIQDKKTSNITKTKNEPRKYKYKEAINELKKQDTRVTNAVSVAIHPIINEDNTHQSIISPKELASAAEQNLIEEGLTAANLNTNIVFSNSKTSDSLGDVNEVHLENKLNDVVVEQVNNEALDAQITKSTENSQDNKQSINNKARYRYRRSYNKKSIRNTERRDGG